MMMMMMIKNLYCSLCKVPVIPVTFQLKFNILDRFGKNTQSNLMKICPVVAELLHGDRATGRQGDRATGRQGDRATGRQTDITKLIVAFRNFAKAPKIFPRYT